MKKFILPLLALWLCISCENSHASHICDFIEEAEAQIKDARTEAEVDRISKTLFQNIAEYSSAMTPEDDKALSEDPEAAKEIQTAVESFKATIATKLEDLHSKTMRADSLPQ
ncbi:secreted protein [gut metagenome]|uniref:Secreted protein n=1 Tax=gut metagenome TaxID=749906 RepID=J9GHC1_9ZZZZ